MVSGAICTYHVSGSSCLEAYAGGRKQTQQTGPGRLQFPQHCRSPPARCGSQMLGTVKLVFKELTARLSGR